MTTKHNITFTYGTLPLGSKVEQRYCSPVVGHPGHWKELFVCIWDIGEDGDVLELLQKAEKKLHFMLTWNALVWIFNGVHYVRSYMFYDSATTRTHHFTKSKDIFVPNIWYEGLNVVHAYSNYVPVNEIVQGYYCQCLAKNP